MVILKQNGKKRLPIIFYIFLIGAAMNLLWWNYTSSFYKISENVIGENVTRIVYTISFICSYPIEWATTLFAIVYYFITKKKIFGFLWMIILCIFLFLLPFIVFIGTWTGGIDPAYQYRIKFENCTNCIPSADVGNTNTDKVFAYPVHISGRVYIDGEYGEEMSVHNSADSLLFSTIETIDLSPYPNGIYWIKKGGKAIKVLKE
ncbi:MAG: hypothetical protein LBT27_08420 [Prevotellaceae bacterium]|jgi:hypothetical protein|nr:hypothetical protein [Prevotellaceae bacterium]